MRYIDTSIDLFFFLFMSRFSLINLIACACEWVRGAPWNDACTSFRCKCEPVTLPLARSVCRSLSHCHTLGVFGTVASLSHGRASTWKGFAPTRGQFGAASTRHTCKMARVGFASVNANVFVSSCPRMHTTRGKYKRQPVAVRLGVIVCYSVRINIGFCTG